MLYIIHSFTLLHVLANLEVCLGVVERKSIVNKDFKILDCYESKVIQ